MPDEPESAGAASGLDADVIERLSAEEAFGLLGHETRLAILRVLFDRDAPATFSELRDAVGVRDSGQFNYHLDKAIGHFVHETEDGYDLTFAGEQVVGAILAGGYTKTVESAPVDVGADCPHCGGPLTAFFEDGTVRVACPDCEHDVISLEMPPGVFEEYPREEWPFVAERWTRQLFETAQAGFCPVCRGPTTTRVVHGDADDAAFDVFAATVVNECERCGEDLYANVGAYVVSHPAVVSFYHEHGVDVRTTPVWALDWTVEPLASVVSEDPLRVEVPIEVEDARLVLTLDDAANVVSERRE